MADAGILNMTGQERRVLGGLLDQSSKSANRICEPNKLVLIEMQRHKAIGKVELPASAED
jgi:hypothetical protein